VVHIAEEEKKDEKKEGTDDKIECPTCGAKVASDATECPECGEKLGDEEKEETEEEMADEDEMEDEEISGEPQPSSSTFYAGILVFLLGIALVFGAVIHALYGWPKLGSTENTGFGTYEKVIAIVGVLFFLIGLGLIAVSMKKPAGAPEEEEEDDEEEDEEGDEEEEEPEEKKTEKEEDEEEEEEKDDKKKK
jgi:DNA-directed RNA polymerase subunit RPC12/RpoP/preprotein translocase subunit SecG